MRDTVTTAAGEPTMTIDGWPLHTPPNPALDSWMEYRGLTRTRCRAGNGCDAENPCDHCQAYRELGLELAQSQAKYQPFLELLRKVCEVFPDEVRDALAPVVFDLLEEFHTE